MFILIPKKLFILKVACYWQYIIDFNYIQIKKGHKQTTFLFKEYDVFKKIVLLIYCNLSIMYLNNNKINSFSWEGGHQILYW
jgi:hypothetical protein